MAESGGSSGGQRGVAADQEESVRQQEEKTTWVPDTYVIIFFVVLLAAVVTYFIPLGVYETREVTYQGSSGGEETRTVLIPESFRLVTGEDGEPSTRNVGLFSPSSAEDGTGFLNYVFAGLVSGGPLSAAVGVVAFIIIIGGAFGIVMRTRAVETGMYSVIGRLRNREGLVIPVLFLLFSLGGAVFGMGEGAIAFAMILIPIIVALGYDAITGVMVIYVATQIGFAASWMNPFGVAIAQGIAGVPVISGAAFRIAIWVFFTTLGIVYTYLYARRIKANPERSLSYTSDEYFRNNFQFEGSPGDGGEASRFRLGHALVLLTVAAGVAWIIWGVAVHAYYIPEIATQFFTIGLVAGIIGVVFRLNDMGVNDVAAGFKQGAQDLLPAALIVGMAQGIIIILGGDDPSTPSVLNTILHQVSEWTGGLPAAAAAWFMYLFQTIFNFFVVSGSGQAALVMPLMAPLADVVGVTRQVAVLAYQLGDGFTNIIVPTSAALMGTLGAARLDWVTWVRFVIYFFLLLFVFSSVIVVFAQLVGFSATGL